MSKLLSQGGFGCVYYPGIKCNGKAETNKKVVTKLQKNDESAENEIELGRLVMEINNYQLYFLPVVSSCPVSLRTIAPKLLTECASIPEEDRKQMGIKNDLKKDLKKEKEDKDKDQYILMEIPYVINKSFYAILIDMYSSKKHIIIGLIENYTYLLEALDTLQAKQIVHFDIKSENILYNQQTHLPLILDFGVSLYIPNINDQNMKQYFYVYSPDYYIWSLEIHVINFLLHEAVATLSEADIKAISREYVKHNKGLVNFSQDFHADYLKACETYLRQFIGKDKKKTIDLLLSFYPTWDNYSLSILYLKTLSYMFPQGFHKNSLILYFSQMLLYNIHPDQAKRYSLEETKQRFKDIFFMEEDVDNYVDFIDSFAYDAELTTQAIQADLHQLGQTRAMTMTKIARNNSNEKKK